MKRLILLLSFLSIYIYAGNEGENDLTSNPLVAEFNTIISYNSLSAENIVSAVDYSLDHAKESLQNIYNIKKI